MTEKESVFACHSHSPTTLPVGHALSLLQKASPEFLEDNLQSKKERKKKKTLGPKCLVACISDTKLVKVVFTS